jgi:hypothetical protein
MRLRTCAALRIFVERRGPWWIVPSSGETESRCGERTGVVVAIPILSGLQGKSG